MNNRRKRTLAHADQRSSDVPARPRSRSVLPVMIPSTAAQNEFGRVLDQAAAGQDIAITRHNVVRAVLVSGARYDELVGRKTAELDELASRFDDLYASMQSAAVREATDEAVHATPEEMGRAAVAEARRARGRRG